VLKDRPGGQTSPVLQNVWLRLFLSHVHPHLKTSPNLGRQPG
jgi:hypothetical protein